MARRSTGKNSTSAGTSPAGKSTPDGKGARQGADAATKGAIREEFLRKKDELLKLKSLDILLVKDAIGINIGTSDMKPELRKIVKKLLSNKGRT